MTFKRARKEWILLALLAVAVAVASTTAINMWLPRQTSPSPSPPQPTPTINPKIGIVDQFYNESPSFTDELMELLSELGLEAQVHKDTEVTVGLYRRLPSLGYKLIILRVHAGVEVAARDQPVFLFTSESYNSIDHPYEQLTDQIMAGVMDPDKPEEKVFSIGPKFVKMSMKGNFKGATIILSSCLGLYNDILADQFIRRGADIFISWDDLVSLNHTDSAVMELLKALLRDGKSVDEAIDHAMTEVGPDRQYASLLLYYPPGAGKIKPIERMREKEP